MNKEGFKLGKTMVGELLKECPVVHNPFGGEDNGQTREGYDEEE